MDFSGLPLGHLDQVALAAHDILHGDSWIRAAFGGRTLTGTVSVDPGSTALVGTGTSFVEDIGPGSRLVLGDQVAIVDDVDDDENASIAVAHYAGLIDATVYVAARGYRIDRPDSALPSVADPHWTVAAGTLGEFSPEIGRLGTNPQVVVSFFYSARWDSPLRDDEGSWGALTQRVVLRFLQADGVKLMVPRFDNLPLARQASSPFVAEGTNIISTADATLYVPALALNWIGGNPETLATYPKRW